MMTKWYLISAEKTPINAVTEQIIY